MPTCPGCFPYRFSRTSIDAAKQCKQPAGWKSQRSYQCQIRQTTLNILWRKGSGKEQWLQWTSSDFWQKQWSLSGSRNFRQREQGFLTGEQWFMTEIKFLTENVDFWQDISGFLTREQGFLRWWFFSEQWFLKEEGWFLTQQWFLTGDSDCHWRTWISDRTLMPITEKNSDFWQVFDRNEDEAFFFPGKTKRQHRTNWKTTRTNQIPSTNSC